MEIKILQVFYGKDGLPYKDKERQVHFPITGTGFLGASNTTQIKFYYDELNNLDETTWVAVSKLPNGKIGSRVLESHTDSELNEHYALLELDSYYTQYKGDVFISLQGYQGGVNVDYNEETSQYEIYGTPTIAATGSIKFTINYANQFVGSGQTDNVTLQRILADLGTKLGIRARSEHVDELPAVGESDIFYVINNDLNDPNKQNIYIWNAISEHYIWVGDNTLDLGDYYTKAQGEQFERDVNETLEDYDNRIESVENELSNVASGSPKGVYATLSDLESAYPTGAEGIYVVSEDGHWYYWNSSAWTDGGAYLSSQDELDTCVVNKNILFGGYDETITETFGVGYGTVSKLLFIPKGAYVTLTNLTDNDQENAYLYIVYEDGTNDNYNDVVKNMSISFYATKNIKEFDMYITNPTVSLRIQVEPIITKNQNDIEELKNNFSPKNLFNPEDITMGWIGTNSGVISTDSTHCTSGLIPVKSGKTYTLRQPLAGWYGETGASRIPLFDENGNFVTYTGGTLTNGILTFTTPIYGQSYGSYGVGNFKYCRFSTNYEDRNITMFVEGDTYPNEFIAYNETLLASDIGLNTKQKEEVQDLMNVNSPLLGKKIAYNGDSICESRLNESSNAYNGGAYAKLIADVTGCTYENRAISGGILASDTPDHNPPARTVCTDVSNMASDADLICFEGGINDYWRGVPLGTFSESDYTSAVDTTTLLGALESIIRQATAKWIGKPICFIIVHKITNTVYATNSAGYTFQQAHDQMKALCKKYAIPVFDAFEDSGLNAYNPVQNTNFLTANSSGTPDGCHPNKAGYEDYYVPQLIKLFESLIKRNN